jgi:hypothetical protein
MDDALGEEIFWLCPRTWRRPLFERYRAMPMVCEGAFKYSANAMYSFVFIGLWGIALLLGSQAALAVVLFQHAYIWVHWYCTEQPDEVVLYGQSPDQ